MSKSGERVSASAIAACGIVGVERSLMLVIAMPVAFWNSSIGGLHRHEIIRPHDRLEVGLADALGGGDDRVAFVGRQRRAPERRRPQRGEAEASLQYAAARQRVLGHGASPSD